ncbi:MAG: phosphoribosylformylglycinamidine synthase subunit PurS [candidate division NC10 bacterium]|nr:phosphoribosylformylglycinamidine synthase subunit PurS [candidate division NC10 bacterium]
MVRANIYVTLKQGVLDPQGETVRSALESLGFKGVREVRMGKFLVITLNGMDVKQAEAQIDEMCRRLLANPVIEDYAFELATVPESKAETA